MSWDIFFDHTWSQRIEKEEKACIEAHKAAQGTSSSSGGSKQRKTRSRHGSEGKASGQVSPALSAAGSHALTRSPSSSACGSKARSGVAIAASGSPAGSRALAHRSKSTPAIPEHLQAITRFPLTDQTLINIRKDGVAAEGKIPQIRMHREKVKAMWWPGIGTYTKFRPEFCLEEPPAWTPDDILKPRKRG
mmetsp:Transcript_18343/g.51976  ORF Transcript_18343/g.51976 Transcript_18343/m.51976 type:complete len:191 (+) Transcript_18343:56-628(+)